MRFENYDYNDELLDYVNSVKDKYNPAMIILFGSLTTGDYWHNSDADIIVILRQDRVNHLTKGLELRKIGYDLPLDLFVYGTQQFIDMIEQGNLLALDAMEYGQIIWTGDEKYLDRLTKKWEYVRARWQPTDYGWKGIE